MRSATSPAVLPAVRSPNTAVIAARAINAAGALARGQTRSAEANLISARERYIQVVGKAPGKLESPPALAGLPAGPEDAVGYALDHNPDLGAARERSKAAGFDSRAAGSNRLPSVSLFASGNYTEIFGKFAFGAYLWNSVFITVVATVLTLLFNSMAAFALSKYQFKGQKAVFLLIIATLMIPPTIILVPVFLVINSVGLLNSLWGVILPAVATPTGVFLLRQYMLTIPDELLEAARMDHASEWRIYWKIILPLSAPALAVLAIFSVMWRWNDFLLPLIVLSRSEFFTLQLALNSFQGELNTQWNYLLAMTVITLIPITLVFAFLQKYITTGIASAGVK